MRRLLEGMPQGGVLAIQMPDKSREPALKFQREVGEEGPWRDHPEIESLQRRDDLQVAGSVLRPCSSRSPPTSDILAQRLQYMSSRRRKPDRPKIVKGSSLQPFLSPLGAADREKFLPPAYLQENHRRL